MADRIKLIVALLIVVAGLVGFYVYSEQSFLYSVLGLLALILVAVGISMTTELGKASWKFLQDARTEVRKVVWPTRKETSQTTLLIMLSVIVVGIMLWGLDSLLLWAVELLTGQGS
jgi:preprotein translocase subunit SecE